MNKILRKAATVITAVLAISTSRSAAQSACSSDRFTAAMQVIGTSPATPGRCFSCHSNFPVNNEQAWVPHYVVPGNPASSLLWQRLTIIPPPPRTIMPPSGRLPQDELNKIYDWIARFDQTTVTVLAQPSNGGTVTGGGAFPIGSSRTITATPNLGWTFAGWNDGNPAASQNITVPSCDVTYTASFQPAGSSGSSLANVSTRASVQTGDGVLIAGFILTGTDPKQVIVRGLGPTLGQPPFNVPNALQNPVLELHLPTSVITNDDWQSAANANQIPTSPVDYRPPNSLESAILITLQPGTYTAIMSGKNSTTGNGLVEVYDLATSTFSQLTNVSTRGFVGTGDNRMIAGFVTSGGNGSTQVVVRGLGPTLGQPPFNLSGVLADPLLTFVDGNGMMVQNNNWKDTQQAAIQAASCNGSTCAPPNDLEAAILITVPPGNYTAILEGNGGGTGIGLVEVYKLP